MTVGALDRRLQSFGVARKHDEFLPARHGRIENVAPQHDGLLHGERNDDARKFVSPRLVDRHGVRLRQFVELLKGVADDPLAEAHVEFALLAVDLRDDPDVVSVFIHAPLSARVYRATHVYEIDEDKAEDVCLKSDKTRANFYNYYSDMKWGMCRTYDLSLDSASLGIEGCIEMILKYTEVFKRHQSTDGEKVE